MTDTRSDPVKIVIERRVRPGALSQFEQWIRSFTESAARYPGFEGSSVFNAASGDYVILLRFASQPHLDGWRAKPEVDELFADADAASTAVDQHQVKTGLETWFTLPGVPPPSAPPPRWKMALVTWLALLPQVVALSFVIPISLPFLAQVALSTAIPVAMLTWVVMPRLTKILYEWLYAVPHP